MSLLYVLHFRLIRSAGLARTEDFGLDVSLVIYIRAFLELRKVVLYQ